MDVQDVCLPPLLLLALVGIARTLVRHRAPAAQRTHQVLHILCQAIAAGAEAHRAEFLHPSIRVQQPLQQCKARGTIGIPIDARDVLLVALDAPQPDFLQPLFGGMNASNATLRAIRNNPPVVRAVVLEMDAIADAGFHPLNHLRFRGREGEAF
jgi:hypothetical protein